MSTAWEILKTEKDRLRAGPATALLDAPAASFSVSTRAREPEPSLPPSAVATVLAATLVRCADCRYVHYRSSPPPRDTGPLWSEWLECDHSHTVTERELYTPTRYCTKFNRRSPSR